MSGYVGDFRKNDVVDIRWNSSGQDGASIAYTGGTFYAYKNNETATEVTAGITPTISIDTKVGINHIRVDTSADALYANGNDYFICMIGATIETKTVNACVGHFSLRNRKGIIDEFMATIIDGTKTFKNWMVLMGAVVFGTSGSSGFRFNKQDGSAGVTATVNGSKERTAMSLNP